MTEAYPRTLLSLPRYGQIMGINPLHFAGGATPELNPTVLPSSGCDDIWHKYDWQDHDKVSLIQLAHEIYDAEHEIARFLGYWPAPYWIEEELHQYPHPYPRDMYSGGWDVRDRRKTVIADYGKIISAYPRAVELIGEPFSPGGGLAYTDSDGDGFFETATVTLATTETNVQLLKLYFTGHGGDAEWEIRPVRDKIISGGNVIFYLDSWLLINPTLYEEYPTSDTEGQLFIDTSTTANFVTEVAVYKEYPDITASSVTFYWATDLPRDLTVACPQCGTIGCVACAYDTQDGCAIPKNHKTGELIVFPATYDSDSAAWGTDSWLNCIEPDIVKIAYVSGDQSQEYLQGRTHEPMSLFFEQVIAWLATARLERPLCTCGRLADKVDYLQQDLSAQLQNVSFFLTPDVLDCPFGTRRGEVMAWRRLKRSAKDRRFAVAVV